MLTFSIKSSLVLPSRCNAGTRCPRTERFSCSNCSGDFCKSSLAFKTLLNAEPLATNQLKTLIDNNNRNDHQYAYSLVRIVWMR